MSTKIWGLRTENSSDLKGRDPDNSKWTFNAKKFHMQVVQVCRQPFRHNSLLKCALRPKIAKKHTKIFYFGGSKSFKDIGSCWRENRYCTKTIYRWCLVIVISWTRSVETYMTIDHKWKAKISLRFCVCI